MKKLRELLSISRNKKGTREVIGIMGTHSGTGVTFTGLMLAFYMGEECGKRTAYLECNDHQDMFAIYTSYNWTYEEEDSFSYHRVTCFPEVDKEKIVRIMDAGFECIIMDFGSDYESYQDELMRCTTKIIVGGRAPWEMNRLNRFLDKAMFSGGTSYRYLIPQAGTGVMNALKNELSIKVSSVPFVDDPVLPSKTINQFFKEIL